MRIQVGHWNQGGPVGLAYEKISALGKITTLEHLTHEMTGVGTKLIAEGIQVKPSFALLLLLLVLIGLIMVATRIV
jgi:hypothetical protein